MSHTIHRPDDIKVTDVQYSHQIFPDAVPQTKPDTPHPVWGDAEWKVFHEHTHTHTYHSLLSLSLPSVSPFIPHSLFHSYYMM